ncbi:DUF3302 domain-containing protein [Shewanella sp. NIFS-20-20]|uniref:DUF3302 domain-containing protein n=1 Tax=Shewanella sp. NIFS-20-20 TaxID=2853806 RepID=UPI001C44435A|nr:DUF3302 domain-containing protein [Shewanella sp. NIFS-20-20]MBV7314443.1 DUF3302 domain-containing protein [Shewanella sp. NIFS-20-20]
MFLDYFALGVLIFVVLVLFYGIIVIHDIPYEIAKKRNHPQQDALHIAGWVSLFTLHAIWPFLWIWATLYREDRGWGFNLEKREEALESQVKLLQANLGEMNSRLALLETQQALGAQAVAPITAPKAMDV